MKISVFGLGYVGCVSSAAFTHMGHKVIGVDVNKIKVGLINKGKSPIVEKDLEKYISKGVKNNKLTATTDTEEAVLNSDISLICVGTPSTKTGGLDLTYTKEVCEAIGKALKKKKTYHIIIFKSTMLPGSAEDVLTPVVEKASGKKAGKDFDVASNPEFLRESTAIYDFFNPPSTVIGANSKKAADTVKKIYRGVSGPFVKTTIKTAEMVKYTDNCFHGLKAAFGNEIGDVCKKVGVDGHELMRIFCLDTKLNLSPYYFKPGFPFGGSCLPKDVRGMNAEAKKVGLNLPILRNIIPSNENQVEICTNMILDTKKRRIGILGLSFKADTDDVRESPIIEIINKLRKKGKQIMIYDSNVLTAQKFGANKDVIEKEAPHLMDHFTHSIAELIKNSEVIVFENKDKEFEKALPLIRKDQIAIDFVRFTSPEKIKGKYEGLGW